MRIGITIAMNLDTMLRIALRSRTITSKETMAQPSRSHYQGLPATIDSTYPIILQVPMAPVPMSSNIVQAPMQGNENTATLGQMQDVMMYLNDVGIQDNPLFMEMTEVQKWRRKSI